ncbi:MAG: hypothetical protein IJ011_02565 [Clostridia bacterium]|nr:hypothetical protein [Clostridia bacterium]
MKRLAKIIAVILSLLTLTAVFASCAGGKTEEIINTVKFPESYSISYEVKDADGIIRTLSKTVDAEGNVHFVSGEYEIKFICDGENYTEYTKDENGEFISVSGTKVNKEYVEAATAEFHTYAEESLKQHLPTAEEIEGENRLGRECRVFEVVVGIKSFNTTYLYYVDSETGICLGFESSMVLAGIDVQTDDTVFTCVEFITEGIEIIEV